MSRTRCAAAAAAALFLLQGCGTLVEDRARAAERFEPVALGEQGYFLGEPYGARPAEAVLQPEYDEPFLEGDPWYDADPFAEREPGEAFEDEPYPSIGTVPAVEPVPEEEEIEEDELRRPETPVEGVDPGFEPIELDEVPGVDADVVLAEVLFALADRPELEIEVRDLAIDEEEGRLVLRGTVGSQEAFDEVEDLAYAASGVPIVNDMVIRLPL